MAKKLTLKKEVLVQLTPEQLGSVVGAAVTKMCLLTHDCITPVPATRYCAVTTPCP